VEVIVAVPASLPALKKATSTVPVVMTGDGDPVAAGFAQSLGRPGGNFTGLSNQLLELIGKQLELLKQLVPTPAPVGVVWDGSPTVWRLAEAAARDRDWKLLSLEIRRANEIDLAFKTATAARARTCRRSISLLLDWAMRAWCAA
jgi:putative ABC transport system substrate-binding protein